MFAEKIIREEIRAMDDDIHFCSSGLGYRIFPESDEEQENVIALLMRFYPHGKDMEDTEDENE